MGRLRYSIPNSFTALSLLLGLGSIVSAQLGDLEFAAWLIVWCGLLDTMDGLAARLLKATSDFGAEFDSMADLVSFGVAPGVLVFNAGLELGNVQVDSGQFWVLTLACGVFVLAGPDVAPAAFDLDPRGPENAEGELEPMEERPPLSGVQPAAGNNESQSSSAAQ